MLLRMLETENFLSHEKESIAFPDEGIFLLSGPSGSGKSSFIIDAMAYALFGAVATRAKKQVDLHSRDSAGSMSVRVTFDLPDRRIVVARGLDERGSSWAQLYEDKDGKGVLLAEGSAPVQRMIRRELGGMTWQQFYAAFVARQSEISMLTSLRGAERKSLVQRMLGMRELEKTSEIISSNIRRFGAEASELEKSRGLGDAKKLEEEIENLRKEIEGIDTQEKDIKDQIKSVQEKIKSKEQESEPLRLAAERASERAASLEKLARYREKLSALEEQQKFWQEYQKIAADEDQLRENLQNLEKEQEDLREVYRQSLERKKLQEELGRVQVSRGSLSETESEIKVLEEKAKGLISNVELQLQRADDLRDSGQCDLCLRPFENQHDLQKAIEEMENAKKNWETELLETEEKILVRKNLLPDLRINEESKKQKLLLEKRIEGLADEDPDKIKKEGLALKERVSGIRNRLAQLEVLSQSSPVDSEEITKLTSLITKTKESIPPEGDVEGWRKAEKEILNMQKEKSFLEGSLPEVQLRKKSKKEELDKKTSELSNKQEELQKLSDWNQKMRQQEDLQTYLRAYQKHLAHEIRPALEEIGSEMIRRVSGGKHVAIKVDDNYEIEVEDSQGRRLSAHMISGGEAVRANICLRLALTRLVSQRTGVPVAFLVFDEPLPAQDEGHIERIMELLDSLRPFYRQQFVISHVGNLAVSGEVDYVLSFEDGIQLLRA